MKPLFTKDKTASIAAIILLLAAMLPASYPTPDPAQYRLQSILTATALEPPSIHAEIPIDFPVPFSKQGYTLFLMQSDPAVGEFDLKVCDPSGSIIQKLPCGKLIPPIHFSYDGLVGDVTDLEIFSSNSNTGILFLTNYDANTQALFYEEAIEIPKYDEATWSGFLSSEETDTFSENTVYQINRGTNKAHAVRRWDLQKETGHIVIQDLLKNQIIYEGDAVLDEDGYLVNEEYYSHILWDNLYRIDDYSANPALTAWINVEFDSIPSFLAEFGFANKEPVYQYYDTSRNLQLELYRDQAIGQGCGIVHQYRYNYQLEQVDYTYGFTFDSIENEQWAAIDPYSLEPFELSYAEETEDLEEIFEYTASGKLAYYKLQGNVGWLHAEEEEEAKENAKKDLILDIAYLYRDDGTLFYRKYSHNPNLFGTFFQTIDTYYDEAGRILYEHRYVTHGSYDYYYIYEDDGVKPTYCLSLDNNLGCYLLLAMTHFW